MDPVDKRTECVHRQWLRALDCSLGFLHDLSKCDAVCVTTGLVRLAIVETRVHWERVEHLFALGTRYHFRLKYAR
jgi:hypothetical protein